MTDTIETNNLNQTETCTIRLGDLEVSLGSAVLAVKELSDLALFIIRQLNGKKAKDKTLLGVS